MAGAAVHVLGSGDAGMRGRLRCEDGDVQVTAQVERPCPWNNLLVSYDLAVWEGERPADDWAARQEYRRLYDRFIGSRDLRPPTPQIAACVRALLDRYPEDDTPEGEDSPWAGGPLIRCASGPFLYFPMVYSQCDGASAWAAQVSREHGLVCFDPQTGQLRP